MTARDIGETSPRYQIYFPLCRCDGWRSSVMGEEKMLWFFGVRRRCASRNHSDDVGDFTSYGGGFSGRLQIRFFFRMSGGVRLARLRFVESVFGLLSRSKWTLSASNQYPKVV
ncbi:hypothetical protein F2Q70_00011142 [Brassica cretica]|uniref:Uncharacterized protein n=1 Tax=Brassica cretica TaxID=69181 RepID=A0A8S9M408_BRACR|nr:hypothetical protein F2Q70_00011142 [Brassica cretica]